METTIIIKSTQGKTIFEYSQENNIIQINDIIKPVRE